MSCPYCAATVTTALSRRTTLGYRMFRCRACRRTYNERTNTPFNLCWPFGSSVHVMSVRGSPAHWPSLR